MDNQVVSYVEPVFRFCLNRLSSRQDAEDLAQEIITQVLVGLRKYEVVNTDAWVWQVARNCYARRIRAQSQMMNEITSYGVEMAVPGDFTEEFEVKEEHQAVSNALHRLSASYRNIVVDYYVHNVPTTAIAKKYGLPLTTVKWRLHHGREQIREGLSAVQRVYDRINWNTRTCNGSMDSNRYMHSQLARAICLSAYEEPLTIPEISEATGAPAMYIEDELERLIAGDAVVAANDRYYTNFIVLRLKDHKRMTGEFAPYVGKLADMLREHLTEMAGDIAAIGFYGSNFGVDRLGYIIVPLVLRKAISRVQHSNDKLKYGPYPPRKDGGYGWFIVQETESASENDFAPAASGCNMYYEKKNPERGMFAYLWIGKYFDVPLYRQGMEWMFSRNIMKGISNGVIPTGYLNEEDLAKMARLNLLQRDGDTFRMAIPAFSQEQFEQLNKLIDPFVGRLESVVSDLVVKIWSEFHTFVPDRIADQINQYVAFYTNRIIGLTMCEMIADGMLAQPPKHGPLSYSVLYVDRPVPL